MQDVIHELPALVQAFALTVGLTLVSGVAAFVLGVISAIMRISPIPTLQFLAAGYVRLVRNTPLPVIFFLVVFGLPQVGITFDFVTFSLIALSVYTGTFVSETIRSGVQAIPRGEIEAARSLGLSLSQIITKLILPQALRTIVPPMASVSIALLKNSSIAGAFGVFEAIGQMTSLVNVYSDSVLWFMAAVALGYVILAMSISRVGFAWVERRAKFLR